MFHGNILSNKKCVKRQECPADVVKTDTMKIQLFSIRIVHIFTPQGTIQLIFRAIRCIVLELRIRDPYICMCKKGLKGTSAPPPPS